ncbi:DNA primase [Pelagicoccus sp. SDUM812002]|uniref:DNA primase n=1 Tax=Pelagicoccus sp. SDUM812002 TaxID=3041266 RepID=UPI0028101DA3|nr:DNA primase [Pelagicoccus sp. SDUM812002]MDQ8184397.1 DNA primase [Pelagicoccus sp. SDUM812002]
MPAIKPSSIRDLKDRINIYDVVSREVTLKKAGADYKGLSPFNNEKTPSFYVSPDKGFYKCFSSGNSGDAIAFVMETERLTFTEAVEALAKRFNFELEYEQGNSRAREERSLRQELFEIHELATDFFREQFLAADKAGEWIRKYWVDGRKFSLDIAEEFKIGFAPINSVALGERAVKKGFSKEAMEACGLFYAKRGIDPHRMGYRFRGRLMIPIRDHQGRVTAFTARQLEVTPKDDPSHEAKYINSPETPIFHKGNLLFNLDRARMEVKPETPFVMVEGQLDAIRCWSVGITTSVAPQGTGITESQLRLLKRYESRLVVLLDGDSAGQKAALRMLPLALAQGVEAAFIPLTDKEDPDDIFREGGREALDQLLKRELQPIPFACRAHMPPGERLTPQSKAKAIREVFSIIEQSDSEATKIEFVKQAAEAFELDEDATISDFQRFSGQQVRQQRPTPPPPLAQSATPQSQQIASPSEPKRANRVYSVEHDLLALCMLESDLGNQVAHLVDPDWIDATLPAGKLLNFVLNEFLHDMWNGPDSLNEHLESAEERTLASSIYFEAKQQENPERFANEALKRLVVKFVDRKSKEIKLEIGRKQATNDDPAASALLGELFALNQLKHKPPQLGSLFS